MLKPSLETCAPQEQPEAPNRILRRLSSPTIVMRACSLKIMARKGAHERGMNSEDMRGEDEQQEKAYQAFALSGDEGAKRYNEILDDGSDYILVAGYPSRDYKMDLDDESFEYRDPELADPGEETLPPGEIELIFENSYVM